MMMAGRWIVREYQFLALHFRQAASRWVTSRPTDENQASSLSSVAIDQTPRSEHGVL